MDREAHPLPDDAPLFGGEAVEVFGDEAGMLFEQGFLVALEVFKP
jgi:hypothetical protein